MAWTHSTSTALPCRLAPSPALSGATLAVDAERKQETFWRGIECFNRRQFFTCHELLEEIWLEEPEEEKPFYQGLIQVAAGFHHLVEKKNPRGAVSLISAGVEKLRRYPPLYHGLDLAGFLTALAPWLDRLERQQPCDDLSLPTIKTAPSTGVP